MTKDQHLTSDTDLRHDSQPSPGRAMAVLLLVDLTLFLGLSSCASSFVAIGGWAAASGLAKHPWLNLMLWHMHLAEWLSRLSPRPPAAVTDLLFLLVTVPTAWLCYLWIARRVAGRTLGQWLVPSKAGSATVASRIACHMIFWCSAALGAFYGPTILWLDIYTVISIHDALWGWLTARYGTILAATTYACVFAPLTWSVVKTATSWRQVAHWLTFFAYTPDERTLSRRGLGAFIASVLATAFGLCVCWQLTLVVLLW